MSYPYSELSLEGAAICLRRGGVCIYPTETFFGVGCKVCDAAAVDRVYAVKRRKWHLPLPVIGAHAAQLEQVAHLVPGATPLMERFWPGPLTLLLPARPCVPERITAGTGRIAVRVSSHAMARALAEATQQPLAASSANISGRPAVTCPADLDVELCSQVDGVYSAGIPPCGGLPSTLVELVEDGLVHVLRTGAVSTAQLESAGYAVIA